MIEHTAKQKRAKLEQASEQALQRTKQQTYLTLERSTKLQTNKQKFSSDYPQGLPEDNKLPDTN